MPRLSIPDRDRSKTRTITAYDPEWLAILRLVRAKKLHSPFDAVRFVLWESTDAAVVAEREKGNFHHPRLASIHTLGHRKKKLSRAA